MKNLVVDDQKGIRTLLQTVSAGRVRPILLAAGGLKAMGGVFMGTDGWDDSWLAGMSDVRGSDASKEIHAMDLFKEWLEGW